MLLRILLLLMSFGLSTLSAADLYWNPNAGSDGNDADNWTINDPSDTGSRAVSIDVDAKLHFDGSGPNADDDCTFTASLTVAALTGSTYSGTISDGGHDLTVIGGDVTLFSGSLNLSGTLSITAPSSGTSYLAIGSGQALHTVTLIVPTALSTLVLDSDITILNTLGVTGNGSIDWQDQCELTLLGPDAASSFASTIQFTNVSNVSTCARIVCDPSSGGHSLALPSDVPLPGLEVKGITTLQSSGGSGRLQMDYAGTLSVDASTSLILAGGTSLVFTDQHPEPSFGDSSSIYGVGTFEWNAGAGSFITPGLFAIECPVLFTGSGSYTIPGGWTFTSVTMANFTESSLTIDLAGTLDADAIALVASTYGGLTVRFAAGAQLRSTGDITDAADPSYSGLNLVANGGPVVLTAGGRIQFDSPANPWILDNGTEGFTARVATGLDLSAVTIQGTGPLTLDHAGSGNLSPLYAPAPAPWDVLMRGDGAEISTTDLSIRSITSTGGAQALITVNDSTTIDSIDLSAGKAGVPHQITIFADTAYYDKVSKPIPSGGEFEALSITTSAILGSAGNPSQLYVYLTGPEPAAGTRLDGVLVLPVGTLTAPDLLAEVDVGGYSYSTGTMSWDAANHEVDVILGTSTPAPGAGSSFTPTLARSTGRDTVFNAVCPGTSEGLDRLKATLAGKDETQVIAFTWDATAQTFIRFPGEPMGGIQPWHAWFIATRISLPLDFRGTPVQPGHVPFAKKWNFIGYPPVTSSDGLTTVHDHLLSDLDLEQDSVIQSGGARDAILGSSVFFWNGAGYAGKDGFKSGFGYWVYNEADPSGGTSEALTRTVGSIAVKPSAKASTSAAAYRDPPPPPGQQAKAAAEGGCGGGSGAGLLVVLLLGMGFRRARRA